MNSSKYYTKIKTQKERLTLKKRGLNRGVTHDDYEWEKHRNIKEGEGNCYRKILIAMPKNIRFEETDSESDVKYRERYRIDDEYWEMETFGNVGARWYFGFSLFISLGFLISSDKWGWHIYLIWLISTTIALVNLVYFFNPPKNKEHILDHKNGTVTFPSRLWGPNRTMHFKKLNFFKPSMGATAATATGIQISGPKKYDASFHFSFGLGDNYDSMTLLTWYMDRNRPLPPCDYFEPYRQQDFERRKAEGFPPPLYPTFFSTPEDTKEQQAERNKYWVERFGSEEDGSLYNEILRGDNEFFDMSTRQWVKK